jgi:plastocyanin
MRTQAFRRYLGSFVAVLALLSCSRSSGPAAARPKPVTHTVTIEAVRFNPETLTVNAGDSVVWVNKDPFPHTVKSGAAFESPTIQASQSWTHALEARGEFAYICTLHPTMKAMVKVQ